MKFKIPPVEIPEQTPFKSDPFHRAPFASLLTSTIEDIEDSLVLSVDSPWGHGKTTFTKQWVQSLKNDNRETILFNAFENDFQDDPFIAFSGEIYEFMNTHFKKDFEGGKVSFLDKSGKIASVLATSTIKAGLGIATGGLIKSVVCDELKDGAQSIASAVTGELSSMAGQMCKDKIENYTAQKEHASNFREDLAKLALLVKEKQGFPLTIIIDELDRCKPDFALQLLERIKHYFNVPNVTFVFFICEKQFLNHVASSYGLDKNIENYLQKFVDLFLTLPNGNPYSYTDGREFDYYYKDQCKALEIPLNSNITPTIEGISQLSARNQISMRKCNSILSNFALSHKFIRRLRCEVQSILFFLKESSPEILQTIANGHPPIGLLEHLNLKDYANEDEETWMLSAYATLMEVDNEKTYTERVADLQSRKKYFYSYENLTQYRDILSETARFILGSRNT